MDIVVKNYILDHIQQLLNKNVCCINLTGPLSNLEENFCRKITSLGVKHKRHIINGFAAARIYKSSCNHVVVQPKTFHLAEQAQKEVLSFLKSGDCDDAHHRQDVPSQVFTSSRLQPIVPPNRFTIGPARPTIFQSNPANGENVTPSWRIAQFRGEILHKIPENRIIVINGDASLEKSTALPMYIVEDSMASGTYCKILCVESSNLVAITHSTILAKHLNERVGSRVGFQVHLQSRVCDSTNLIYTTSAFFLRVLMGQESEDYFKYVSHIVVADAHLHHAHTDILLHEIKTVLPHYPHIKIILLSCRHDNTELLSYFEEGVELRLNLEMHEVAVYHKEEIELFMEHLGHSKISDGDLFKENLHQKWADKALQEYNEASSDITLNKFLYLVHSGHAHINYCHSRLGYTILMSAAKNREYSHLNRLLIYENANPHLTDKNGLSALHYAILQKNFACARFLSNFLNAEAQEEKPPPIEFDIISKLLQLMTTTWKLGHILVFLPTFPDLLRLNYNILKMQFIGRIPQDVLVHLFHPNMECDQLHSIMADSVRVKIILATNMAEFFAFLNDITFVIDCGQDHIEKYNPESQCTESAHTWASLESLHRRALIAGRFTAGHCFRLIAKDHLGKFSQSSPAELSYMSLNRIVLTTKLLCPLKFVVDFFNGTIVRPPLAHIHQSVELLKRIEVLDCVEDVTWLGCRLIDVSVDLELGKSLVLSILLKCLDPVLTIVSFVSCLDFTNITGRMSSEGAGSVLQKMGIETEEPSFSDHLTLLRLYQAWQNEKRENTVNDTLSDEETYVINGILNEICEIRTQLVGSLRSSQLIHNQGQLSMHSINTKARNWAVVKAALVGGLYPKLCVLDRTDEQLKSHSRQLCIHGSSTLESFLVRRSVLPSDWILFSKEIGSVVANCISSCTLVNPVTVALFAGRTELDPKCVLIHEENNRIPGEDAAIYIDEWMWLKTDVKSALILYKLRQCFHDVYLQFLQTCGSLERWRKSTTSGGNEISNIADVVNSVLVKEDMLSGFAQPNYVGNRPKAVAGKLATDFDFGARFEKNVGECSAALDLQPKQLTHRNFAKEFFLINIFDSNELTKSLRKHSVVDVTRNQHLVAVRNCALSEKQTYVFVCNVNQRRITNITLAKCKEGRFILRNCYQTNIPIYDIIILCAKYNLNLPPFRTDWSPFRLDGRIGEIILDLI